MMRTENAKITGTMLGIEDHGIMTFFVFVEGDGFGGGMGGYALDQHDGKDKPRSGSGHAYQAIRQILETIGVTKWEDLKGQNCRIQSGGPGEQITAIGHIIKNRWFNIKDYMQDTSTP